MSRTRWLLLGALAAVVIVLAAVLGASRAGPGESSSGIHGRVTGGCLPEECPDAPTPKVGLQRVFRTSGPDPYDGKETFVKKFRSGEDGTFEVELAPGMYWIDEDPRSQAPGFMKAQLVTVRAGHFTEVDLFYDIGMR